MAHRIIPLRKTLTPQEITNGIRQMSMEIISSFPVGQDRWMLGLDGKQLPDDWEHAEIYPKISYCPRTETNAIYWALNKSYTIQVMPHSGEPSNIDKMMVSVDYTDYQNTEDHSEKHGYQYLELPQAYALCVKLFNAFCGWKEKAYGL